MIALLRECAHNKVSANAIQGLEGRIAHKIIVLKIARITEPAHSEFASVTLVIREMAASLRPARICVPLTVSATGRLVAALQDGVVGTVPANFARRTVLETVFVDMVLATAMRGGKDRLATAKFAPTIALAMGSV